MDGVSWSAARSHESFRGSTATADTLSRLASFIARADTKQHVQNPRPSLPMYICQECGKGFPHAADLLQHQELKHTLPKPHRCPSCGQEFSLRSSLQLHKCDREPAPCELCRGISRLGSSPCPACAAQDSDPGSRMQPHVVDRSPYACAPCGRGFSQKQALLHHQQAGCSEPASPSDVADASSLPDESPPVSEGDSARSDCSDAPPGTSGRAVSVCRLCSRTFRSEAGLQRHVQGHHAEEGQDAKGGGAGGDVRNLNEDDNKRLKSNKKLLSCRSCDMVFRSTSQLYMHRKEKHSREKIVRREPRPVVSKRRRKGGTYPCQLCGKVFVHHLSLRAHYRRHTDSSFSSQSAPCATKDSTLSEDAPNKVKPSLGDDNNNTNTNKKAGRGRPRKFRRVFRKAGDAGRSGEVPERVEEAAAAAAAAEREFPCPSCAEVFSLRQELREHVELHQSSVRTRQCSVCASDMDTCKWPSSKRQRLYHCVPCQQGFSALDPFLEHCQEHLRVRVEEDGLTEGYAHPAAKA